MAAANNAHVPGARPLPLWVRLSRWLNGSRVCAVGDCIQLTEPAESHCPNHIRDLRAELGDRRCAEPRCVEPRTEGAGLCPDHREAALVAASRAAAPPGRWNPP